MSEVLNPMMRTFQGEANEYVMLNHSREVYDHYQSLVKGSERISADIVSSNEMRAMIDSGRITAEDEVAKRVAASTNAGMARGTLDSVISAGETAAKVMRFRV